MIDFKLPPSRLRPRFPLGRIVMTAGASQTPLLHDIATALLRHARGDWGDVAEDEKAANGRALLDGSRLLSVYHDRNGTAFWVITEADRSATTVLLPDDY